MLVCLQPLSQYKRKELYKHIKTFELKTQKVFDADTQFNLCICSLSKQECNNKDYHDFVLENNPMKLAYIYSRNRPKQYFMKPRYKVTTSQLDRNLDFIDSSLIYNANKGGGYFAKGGCGYVWNTFGDMSSRKWINKMGVIHFPAKEAKDNFCKYAYNYSGDKYNCLASKLICNVYISEASEEYYYSIPQIDWENIHINQKELWDKGLYDEAVLSEMGLKWNEDKTVIVKDE